jgi:hypothetical protein
VFNPRPRTTASKAVTPRQIVNDDMPFLVDSITNEFDRREIAPICWPIRAGGAARPRRRPSGFAPETSEGRGLDR